MHEFAKQHSVLLRKARESKRFASESAKAKESQSVAIVELQLLEHWWLAYHGCFELVLRSLGTNSIVADLG